MKRFCVGLAWVLMFELVAWGGEGIPVYELDSQEVTDNNDPLWQVGSLGEVYEIDELMEYGKGESLAQLLDNVVGIAMHARGAHALEPNIMGLGGDCIRVYWNGIYLPNASPTRTASPLNHLYGAFVDRVVVSGGAFSVVNGPVSSGGTIALDCLLVEQEAGYSGYVEAVQSLSENVSQVSGVFRWSDERWAFRVSGYGVESGDYESGNDDVVDADFRSQGLALSLSGKLSDENLVAVHAFYQETPLARNSSLPLDTRGGRSWALSVNHEMGIGGEGDAVLTNRIGWSRSEPLLDNRDRPGAPLLVEAEAASCSQMLGSSLQWRQGGHDWGLGVDLTAEQRDATRYRHSPGGLLADRLWPDIRSQNVGAFLRVSGLDDTVLSYSAGIRLDCLEVRAEDLEASSMLSGSVWESYQEYNDLGDQGARVRECLGSVNAKVSWHIDTGWEWGLGANVLRAAPSSTQLYRAFVNALGGGFEIGNPGLKPETFASLESHLRWHADWAELSVGALVRRADDFIERQQIGCLREEAVFGYRNIDADFYGWNAHGEFRPWTSELPLAVVMDFQRVEAKRKGGLHLVEVPPWEASVGLEGAGDGWSLGLLYRYVGRGTNPDLESNSIYQNTEAYEFLDLDIGVRLNARIWLSVEGHNLLDTAAYSYLQPPLASGSQYPSSGSLEPGDAVPLAGRTVTLRLKWEF